jgi:hypothetical protein
MFAALNDLAEFCAGFCAGLRDGLDGVGNIIIQDMRVTQRALDIAVIERLLHELQVARGSPPLAMLRENERQRKPQRLPCGASLFCQR